MGFVLGSALATRLGVGFLPIRKAGKLCVDTDKVSFSNYRAHAGHGDAASRLRQGHQGAARRPMGRDGGTMDGAIRLVERQGGTVVGLAAVAIEENEVTNGYRKRFRCVSGVQQGSRWQTECNAQKLSSFDVYTPELAFPAIR